VTAPNAVTGRVYRWNVFDTYDNGSGAWLFNNASDLFGGVNPSSWTDNNAVASSISSSKDVQRALFTRKGYPGKNALVLSDTRIQVSTTDGKIVAVLFRVNNSTASSIPWTLQFWYSAYQGWGEVASVALNGVSQSMSTSEQTSGTSASVQLSIPAGRTSTVIVVSSSGGPPLSVGGTLFERATVLGFINNSLDLPAGLAFVDDLETATGGYEQ
jgi:hypothetical protein